MEHANRFPCCLLVNSWLGAWRLRKNNDSVQPIRKFAVMGGRMIHHDVIIVGGGLAGCGLAKSLAEHGIKTLVLERDPVYRDRVRGEQMHPWGIDELRELGLYETLLATCGHELPWFDMFLGPQQLGHRDLTTTTPQRAPELSVYHPDMQQRVAQAAEQVGAEVRRGVHVTGVVAGSQPQVQFETLSGRREQLSSRMVVGADGRQSMVRRSVSFETHRDPPGQLIAGVLFEQSQAPVDTSHVVFNPNIGRVVALFPQKHGRLRAYLSYPNGDQRRFQGECDIPLFIQESIRAGGPAEYYGEANAAGPLATFEAADTWVQHPFRDNVALIGDAAASNDPSLGEGLSLAVRDVRVLRDCLLGYDDWTRAGHAYADQHDRNYGVIHDVTRWFVALFLEQSREADARRARALPLIAQDMNRIPDHLFSGPDLPFDDQTRRRFHGED
jgi:2-polyprenyl-6-methoxyphenol hydroxylase-like FAD-dependent oxidoreductase